MVMMTMSGHSDVNDISSGQDNDIDVSMMCCYCIHSLDVTFDSHLQNYCIYIP